MAEAERLDYGASDAAPFRKRVDAWRAYCLSWLEQNLGGHAADEYKTESTYHYSDTGTWTAHNWFATLKVDIESEITVLNSITERLPQWVRLEANITFSPPTPPQSAETRIAEEDLKATVAAADRKAVMVIYGHDIEARRALFAWLRTIRLEPKEWSQFVGFTGSATPVTGQVLEEALRHVQAVVALFTPDERVRPVGRSGPWRLQARPNVLIEAGMALVTHPTRTVMVALGHVELPSDFAGRQYVQLDGTAAPLNDLANRLKNAGCEIDTSGEEWLDPSIFPDRDHISIDPTGPAV